MATLDVETLAKAIFCVQMRRDAEHQAEITKSTAAEVLDSYWKADGLVSIRKNAQIAAANIMIELTRTSK